jgi:hypothetical protein
MRGFGHRSRRKADGENTPAQPIAPTLRTSCRGNSRANARQGLIQQNAHRRARDPRQAQVAATVC